MKKIQTMNCLLKDIFKTPKNFILFPFAIVGCVFIVVFYALCPFYMLAELFVNELRSILKADGEKDTNGAQVVKNLIGFGFVVMFNFFRAVMSLPLAMGYFMTSIAFTLSSMGSIKNNPFAYSTQE